MKRHATMLKKPTMTPGQVLGFAEGKKKSDSRSTAAPAGSTRLTINMRDDLHMKLKMRAVQDRTTAGKLLEELVEKYL